MLVKTILNRLERNKSFVYGNPKFRQGLPLAIEVPIKARKNSKPICSGCGKPGATYDRLSERAFQYVPLWQILVFFIYSMRRVDCRGCGVTVEMVPWAEGKTQLTTKYRWFLAAWARRLSWKEVGTVFQTTWQNVCRSVELAVEWGLRNRVLKGITAIGVDEIQWQRGQQHYLTVVYQINNGAKRLLWIGMDRTAKSLTGFFEMLGEEGCASLEFVCSDMWKPYLGVIAKKASAAIHVLDRFHIMQRMNKAIDEVRAKEARRLVEAGQKPILKHSRWCILKRPENLTGRQTIKMAELLKCNLQTVRAYLHREDFQRFWTYYCPRAAARFLKDWGTRVLRSRIEPMKKVARSLRRHEELLLNWVKAYGTISAGTVEGLNNKAKLTMRKSYGFRSQRIVQLALYHSLGKLPEPNFTHRFW